MNTTANQMSLATPLALAFLCLAAIPVRVGAGESSGQGTSTIIDPAHRTAALPPLLQLLDGTPVRTPEDWNRRKAEIRRLLCESLCGTLPEQVPADYQDRGDRGTEARGRVDSSSRETHFRHEEQGIT